LLVCQHSCSSLRFATAFTISSVGLIGRDNFAVVTAACRENALDELQRAITHVRGPVHVDLVKSTATPRKY
jgi:hypothetical protein